MPRTHSLRHPLPRIPPQGFALAIGGGVDISVAPFLTLRPIQIHDLMTRFGSGDTEDQPRIPVGLMVHL
ncbi:MAG TPA: hypothetical protein VMB47_05480 [Candidatus Aquilonibacter sp.]|nr:hypothetical protein [Candidatus Aquilonibacter sp.]